MTHAIEFLRLAINGRYSLELIAEIKSDTHENNRRSLQYNERVGYRIDTAINEAATYIKMNDDAYRVRIYAINGSDRHLIVSVDEHSICFE